MAFQISSGTNQGGTVCILAEGSGTSSSSSCKKGGNLYLAAFVTLSILHYQALYKAEEIWCLFQAILQILFWIEADG